MALHSLELARLLRLAPEIGGPVLRAALALKDVESRANEGPWTPERMDPLVDRVTEAIEELLGEPLT